MDPQEGVEFGGNRKHWGPAWGKSIGKLGNITPASGWENIGETWKHRALLFPRAQSHTLAHFLALEVLRKSLKTLHNIRLTLATACTRLPAVAGGCDFLPWKCLRIGRLGKVRLYKFVN